MAPKGQIDKAAALYRTILAQPDAETVSVGWEPVRDQLAASIPSIGPSRENAKTEVSPSPGPTGQDFDNPLERLSGKSNTAPGSSGMGIC